MTQKCVLMTIVGRPEFNVEIKLSFTQQGEK